MTGWCRRYPQPPASPGAMPDTPLHLPGPQEDSPMTLHADARTRPRGTPPAGGPAPARGRRSRLTWLDIKGSPYLYVAPFFILFAIFGVYPLIYTLWISLHRWPLLSLGEPHQWLGFGNFSELFHEHQFWNSVYNTFGIFVISTLPQLL